MLEWIGHRNKQYHFIYSSQPGLWSSVLNRQLPSTPCIYVAGTYLLNDHTFVWDDHVCLATALTWAIWVLIEAEKHPVFDKCTDNAYLNWR